MSKVDGRHARAQRTRKAIVDAVLALVKAGDPAPTAAAIARKAKVSVRSIAQHFVGSPGTELEFAL